MSVVLTRLSISFLVLAIDAWHIFLETDGAQILAVVPDPWTSQCNVLKGMFRALTDRGHNVTVFTFFVDGDRQNYNEVHLSNATYSVNVDMDFQEINNWYITPISSFSAELNTTRNICQVVYNDDRMREILSKGENSHFDLVITETLPTSCMDNVAATLKLPMIYIMPSVMLTYLERALYGHMPNPAVSSHLTAPYAWPKSFRERLTNTFIYLGSLYVLARSENGLKKTNPHPFDNMQPVESSLTFGNIYYITEPSRPLPPNFIGVGGIHLVSSKPLPNADGSRILAVVPGQWASHWNVLRGVFRALTERGHHLTVFTFYSDGDRQNYNEIELTNASFVNVGLDFQKMSKKTLLTTPLSAFSGLSYITRSICKIVYNDSRMIEILSQRENAHFDLVITEPVCSLCVDYVAATLKMPMIYIIPSVMLTYLERALYGHMPNPAVSSHLIARYAWPNCFRDRLTNTLLYLGLSYVLASSETDLKKTNPQPFDNMQPGVSSLTFSNTHYITEPSRPLPSNIIQVSGIHLFSPKPIPTDILEFIENSPHGVIYFTFGSVVSMSTLPDHIQKAFKEALAQVPQRVLWKYEGEMKDKPANVMTSKWFPQRDILLHPNVKLFISHGGISGVYEAVDAGVPVLGFPLFYDQPRNIENLVEAGMAISLDLLKVTKKPFLDAVTELINNKSYAENAKITSERFKDRPMTPAESVVYWTEYVIRHKGAPHLRSHALDLTWYQYFLLDVIAALLLALSIAGYVAYKVLKLIYSLASGQLLKNTKHKAE
ncbi:UDP-glucosyltransferase 2-like isoform X1 [Adelges cooleyi]|uniref:UDP-glucosyltransferase 2-like isoform X1 n=1 Tax=Adelges cooleyi TaxID=133065 RepID=UPI00218043CB|nr:UDP-glucosyltransferase 2-like isoform X1 [Adelges cooleyi]